MKWKLPFLPARGRENALLFAQPVAWPRCGSALGRAGGRPAGVGTSVVGALKAVLRNEPGVLRQPANLRLRGFTGILGQTSHGNVASTAQGARSSRWQPDEQRTHQPSHELADALVASIACLLDTQ